MPSSVPHAPASVRGAGRRGSRRLPRRKALPAAFLVAAMLTAAPAPAPAEGLREAMAEMEARLQRLTSAVFRRDLDRVEEAAVALAEAPQPDLGYRLWLLGRLGDDAPRFRRYAQSLTATAEALARQAREGEEAALYPAYRQVLDQCLGCHQAFQSRLGASS